MEKTVEKTREKTRFFSNGGVVRGSGKNDLGGAYMNKYCEICHLEISDTNYDDIHRFIRIKYCDICREMVKKQQKKKVDSESKKERKPRKK